MRLDKVTAQIRPRSDWEAVDLGLVMVRRDFWRCLIVWWLAMAAPMLVAGYFLWNYPIVFLLVIWWLKPAGSRLVLFEISRRLFGEIPSWRAIWKEIFLAVPRRFLYRFIWARLSPWLPVTLSVEQLEGLRGRSYKQRCSQLVRRGEGAVFWMYLATHIAALLYGMAILMVAIMFIPEGQDGAWQQAKESFDWQHLDEVPLLIWRLVVACVMIAMSLTDVFATGAGFGIYINNRTWLEGWDVELAFKRLAQRLGKVGVTVLVFLMLGVSLQGAENRTPSEVMAEVKSHPDFKVHTVIEKVPVEKDMPKGEWDLSFIQPILQVLGIAMAAGLVGLLVWVMWKNRHIFDRGAGGGDKLTVKPSARVVMGFSVAPDSLPDDIGATAWLLWQQGHHQQALGLLYRGAISRVIEIGQLDIQESATEGDCVQQVERAGSVAFPEYFRGITRVWVKLAYAGIHPAEVEVQVLCLQWPYGRSKRA